MIITHAQPIQKKKKHRHHIGTFFFSFCDMFSDALYAFGPQQQWAGQLGIVVQTLLIFEIIIQLLSMWSAIHTVRGQLYKSKTVVSNKFDTLKSKYGCCCGSLIFLVFWFSYIIFMIIVSTLLGSTKIISIRQVEEWWLGLVIHDYHQTVSRAKDERKKALEEQGRLQDQLKYRAEQEKKDQLDLMVLALSVNVGGGFEEWNKEEIQAQLKEMLQNDGQVADILHKNSKEVMQKDDDEEELQYYEGYRYDPNNPGCVMALHLWINKHTPMSIHRLSVNSDMYNTFFVT
ncbi:hypothetical protein RFI_15071 [Reticulomyxa filosa]|uniref:Uncharacterized protein n=1 Tax=Reticulomyxa filosa TaxID=46433 RepID=X6N8Q0_RETFI|nr:hypothetical protein RFI_15071 [Reticulomyxa filosa]|eukprot:ETO22134.1 hypothetical protein RFI_15071 [Reticulomyxa filosa]